MWFFREIRKLPSYVLGLNISGFISSACILKDGEIIAAAAEERFTRIKSDNSFPHNAIRYCLSETGITFSELNSISSGWNPVYYMRKSSQTQVQTFKDRGLFLHYIINELGSANYSKPFTDLQQTINLDDNSSIKIEFPDHHLSHAAYVYYFSGFSSSLIITLDGFGEIHSGGTFRFSESSQETIALSKFPHSMGMIYSTFTEFLGFRSNLDEWKVMALAAKGNDSVYKKEVDKLIKIGDESFNKMVEVDLSFFDYFNFFTPNYYSDKLISIFGKPRKKDKDLEQRHYDIASALQTVVEQKVISLINKLGHQFPDEQNLCLAGGFFMNSVLNGKISSQTRFTNPCIGPCPDDTGISIGSSYLSTRTLSKISIKKRIHNYFGPRYSNDEIIYDLKISKICFEELVDFIVDAAKSLSEGKIIGWFQGRAELGQRALGNRSILADPRSIEMKDNINKYVKFREEFRPFAPSILDEFKENYFEIKSDEDVYFMEKVFKFKNTVKKQVPAVVHNDGTGRIHTVTKDGNKIFYELINEFYKLTGIPVILNTSFNTTDVPIVNSPRDAIDTFYKCGLDVMYLNNIKITK